MLDANASRDYCAFMTSKHRSISDITTELLAATARSEREPSNEIIKRAIDRLSREQGIATMEGIRFLMTAPVWLAHTAAGTRPTTAAERRCHLRSAMNEALRGTSVDDKTFATILSVIAS